MCARCGFFVKGNGYTDHCAQCLWGMHVDVNPGDREAMCGGLMEPVGAQKKGEAYLIFYRCSRCGFKKNNRSEKGDNADIIFELSSHPTD